MERTVKSLRETAEVAMSAIDQTSEDQPETLPESTDANPTAESS